MISVQDLTVDFGTKILFKNINFIINKKDRIALVGKNGAGKSTLLKMLNRLITPSSGSINIPKDYSIGYLPQTMEIKDHVTLIEEVRESIRSVNELKIHLGELESELNERSDYESDSYRKLIEQISDLQDHILIEESINWEAEIEKTLIGLGFERSDFNRSTSEFSGGWRMRIELAKILIKKPDLLLLDEPTNHLDIESIQWLENYIKNNNSAIILVSHDKAFIDNTTNRTIEISSGKIYDYNVNYSKFLALRQERIDQQTRAFNNQQKQIRDTEAFIEKFRYKATKSIQVQSRIKQLEKIELIEVDEIDDSKIKLRFPPAPRSGDYPVIIEELSKSYDEHKVLERIDLSIKRGEKIAFVGKNGAGKSTLIKCIMNELTFSGNLKIGHNVKIGYFAQNQAQLLDGELTVYDTIDRIAVGEIRTKIRDILGAFMFGGEESDKKVKVLSGGERSRLAMIKLLLEPVNLLILDEPTNHLDIKSKEVLKKAINEFTGTAIIVSHDRDFLNGIVDKVYEFKNARLKEYIGGIYEYIEKNNVESQAEANNSSTSSKDKKVNNKQSIQNPKDSQISNSNKLSYFAKREKEKLLKTINNKIKAEENKIQELENNLKELETVFSTDSVTDDDFKKYEETKKKLEDSMSIWELLMGEAEELK
ncbi:MAG: ATP-binding cassette domain-containing protein [Paramuribaculum sp.]|nr:ATP-binding cassette domain-containing protein [Paramuribaculum sp.]